MNYETRILFSNQNNRTNMITTTSIIDSPKKAQEDDLLGIDRYKSGLVRFVESSNTPITIALQGEWGSGKTSLMNTLKEELCDKQNANFLPVSVERM
jgi:predicted KAP-like P-loop ATPase